MMPRFRPVAVLAALSWVAVSVIAAQAVAEEFQCQRGDLVRRIELRFADDADRLPCAVIYWRDTEAPGRPQNLWHADHELEFCRSKAREMVERLESAGWGCEGAPIGSAAATGAPERSSPDPERPDDPAASRGSESASPTARPDQATLRAALARDIQRLQELTAGSPGEFATDTATLGDLNGDGLEDAAVLLTHRAEGAEPTYYLLAYVFNGATFQPVARINLEAYYRNFTEVGIQDVAGGSVDILLHVPRADDPQCCPSGRRQATFGLRDGQLVLLKESEPGA
jgi:hypothetical protein